jgi:DDE superfamily endonuclease
MTTSTTTNPCYCNLGICLELAEKCMSYPDGSMAKAGADWVEGKCQILRFIGDKVFRTSKRSDISEGSSIKIRRFHFPPNTWIFIETPHAHRKAWYHQVRQITEQRPENTKNYNCYNDTSDDLDTGYPVINGKFINPVEFYKQKKEMSATPVIKKEKKMYYFNAPLFTIRQFEEFVNTPQAKEQKKMKLMSNNEQTENSQLRQAYKDCKEKLDNCFPVSYDKLSFWIGKSKIINKSAPSEKVKMVNANDDDDDDYYYSGEDEDDDEDDNESLGKQEEEEEEEKEKEGSNQQNLPYSQLQTGQGLYFSKVLNEFFGFDDPILLFDLLEVLEFFFQSPDVPLEIVSIREEFSEQLGGSTSTSIRKGKNELSTRQQQLITLYYLRTRTQLESSAVIFGTTLHHVRKSIDTWLPRYALIGRLLTSLEHSSAMLTSLLPENMLSGWKQHIAGFLDCRDTLCDTPRQTTSRKFYSNKEGGSCIRQMVFVAPYGAHLLLTEPCPSRVSETAIASFNKNLIRAPRGWFISADKAYKTLHLILPDKTKIILPAFVRKNNPQLSVTEIDDSREQARLRYLVEVSISRLASWKAYDHIVPFNAFDKYDNITFAVGGFSIFCKPLVTPHQFPKARTVIEAYYMARVKEETQGMAN